MAIITLQDVGANSSWLELSGLSRAFKTSPITLLLASLNYLRATKYEDYYTGLGLSGIEILVTYRDKTYDSCDSP